MKVKACPKCSKQGLCHDSRQVSDYVRRRYHCVTPGCGTTWTTAEFFVEIGESRDKRKIRHYRERQAKQAASAILARLQSELSG